MSKLCSYCGLCHDYENCDAQIINEQAVVIDWLNEKNKGLLSLIEQQAAEIELLKNKIVVLREGLQEVVNFYPTTLTGRPSRRGMSA